MSGVSRPNSAALGHSPSPVGLSTHSEPFAHGYAAHGDDGSVMAAGRSVELYVGPLVLSFSRPPPDSSSSSTWTEGPTLGDVVGSDGGSVSIGSSPPLLESPPDPSTSSSSSTGAVGSTVGEENEEVCCVERGHDAVSSGSADVTDTDISGGAPSVLPPAAELAGRVETAVGVPDTLVEATVAGEI